MTNLVCPDCQHENEPERIYCHNCGARLDRTGLAKANFLAEQRTRQHLEKMSDPSRGKAKQITSQLLKLLLGAVAVAAVIVMVLRPNLPPAQKTYYFAPLINRDIVSALSGREPSSLRYEESQVNSYLAATLRRKDSPSQEGFFPLKRVFVQFQEGQCTIHIERRLLKLSIYSGSSYRVAIANGKIAGQSTSGYIGRMPIHPALMKYADVIFSKAWDSLSRERNSVSRLAGIEFHPQTVTLLVTR